jgi:hypothetical protein
MPSCFHTSVDAQAAERGGEMGIKLAIPITVRVIVVA